MRLGTTSNRKAEARPRISLSEARRLFVSAQAFGDKPRTPSMGSLRKLASRLHAFQIDSVNVLARAHYVLAFARLGPYPMAALDDLAYGKRELFEYWGHAACLMPVSLYPLVRYRMDRHTQATEEYMRSERGAYMASVYAEVAERGPLTAAELSNPGTRSSGWWGWWGTGNGKATLEHLYDAGMVAIAGRRGFERSYDITARVIPQAAREATPPTREDAIKQLICLAAKAYGVATIRDLAGYFDIDGWRDRTPPGPRWEHSNGRDQRPRPVVKQIVGELVEEGRLLPAVVEGWREQAFLDPNARVPRSVDARGIVTPFDSLVWDRGRIERLFGMKYSIEMYVPQAKRVYGYYVCPFLLGDTLVARCDLKADRDRRALIVQSAFLETGQDPRFVAEALAGELRQMQDWLGLDRTEVGRRGDLASTLRRAVKPGSIVSPASPR